MGMKERFTGKDRMKILLIQPAKSKKTIGGDDYFIFEPLASIRTSKRCPFGIG